MGQKSVVNQSFPLRTHLKNRILVKIAVGPSFPAKRDFPPDQILFVSRKPEVRLRRIEGFKARRQQRYWAKRHF
jgi:hypothetical protein